MGGGRGGIVQFFGILLLPLTCFLTVYINKRCLVFEAGKNRNGTQLKVLGMG